MTRRRTSRNAVDILHRRYVRDDPERRAALEGERLNADVAQMIHDLRTDAGLTQRELAELIGTTQSVISRLEDADYQGHSLSMLSRIARALNQNLTVVVTARDPDAAALREAFQVLIRGLRRSKSLSVHELARRADIGEAEILAMERRPGYRPSPRTLHKLARFYGLPTRSLAALAGAVTDLPPEVRQSAAAFAARSESCAQLSTSERKVLDDFVNLLKRELPDQQQVSHG